MITATGYSKDPNIMPEGIVVTFGRDMAEENFGSYKTMLTQFLETMQESTENDECHWLHKMNLWPKTEVADVYIITMNRLWGRVKFGWYEQGPAVLDDGREVEWRRMILLGPFERCPFKRTLRGFQGFRYATKLW